MLDKENIPRHLGVSLLACLTSVQPIHDARWSYHPPSSSYQLPTEETLRKALCARLVEEGYMCDNNKEYQLNLEYQLNFRVAAEQYNHLMEETQRNCREEKQKIAQPPEMRL